MKGTGVVLAAILAFTAFAVLSYMEEVFLGMMMAAIIICWPLIFIFVSKVADNYSSKRKEETGGIKQDIIGEYEETPKTASKGDDAEFVVPQKKDASVEKAKEELEKLKRTSELLEEERKEEILTEESFNDLKKQNREVIEKLESEIAKASGEVEERKVYCPKGKHYISERDCIPSKVKGYVICQEHNEEIRVE